MDTDRKTTPWRALLAGAIGGLIGSWAMTQFHVALYGRGVTDTREPQSHRPVAGSRDALPDDAATRAADITARALTEENLDRRGKRAGALLVHYAFGTVAGALYGLIGELKPGLRRGAGVPFGGVVWAGADEVLLPIAQLAHGPRAYPLSVHAEMLAAHVVYGWTTHQVMCAWLNRGRPAA